MQENQLFFFGFYLLLCLLGSGEPVALQWRRNFFFLFSQDGLEVFDGNSTGWIFQFELWLLSDSKLGSDIPCDSFLLFSQRGDAFFVQATSPAEERWKQWRKGCNGALFTMKCFTENDIKF